MPYVITEPCIGHKDASCHDVCPVDAIQPAPGGDFDKYDQLYIDPVACIDCGACEPVCPVEAIFFDADVPEEWQSWVAVNKNFFDPA
ncbi:4Fe-4S dicluster domain-containing protein [Antrihabitans spumae]|uniref:Ferredoxin n=1 Tax=Antrihabitans spumae TaxID=3373370 RepID=A0ABW7JTX7_9NOCA